MINRIDGVPNKQPVQPISSTRKLSRSNAIENPINFQNKGSYPNPAASHQAMHQAAGAQYANKAVQPPSIFGGMNTVRA